MPNVTKACEQCGNAFSARGRASARFCSRRCTGQWVSVNIKHPGGQAHPAPTERPCVVCGVLFTGKRAGQQTCSVACSGRLRGRKLHEQARAARPLATAVCEHCHQPFSVKYPGNPNRFCSPSCRSRTVHPPGPTNPQYRRITVSCATCGKDVQRSPSTMADHTNVYCSVACKNIGLTHLTQAARYNYKGGPYPMTCEVCGTVKLVRHSLVRRFRTCSKRCSSALSVEVQQRVSGLETIMAAAFADLGLQPAHPYRVRAFNLDFAFCAEQTAVECDGIYWHSRPAQKLRDARKDRELSALGWRVVRLSEPDIRKSPAACAAYVLSVLHTAHPGKSVFCTLGERSD